jgi:ribosome-binding factor A
MAGILSKLDKEVKDKNVKVISNILSIDKSKAEGVVSAFLTIMNNYHENEDKVEENETDEGTPSEESATEEGGMKTSSPYKML